MGDLDDNGGYEESAGGYDRPAFKRYKRDESADPTNPNPSIVVHVRNLHPKATEADLIEALSHFGDVAYATCMPNKRMALVEFEELESARKCVVYAQSAAINVAGFPALFNYSTSQMIQRVGLETEMPGCVLILTILNSQYPISVEVVHQICSPHGEVLRIALIRRALVQALVEFESVESARKAKHAMNGADIYSGCCTLKVEFARPEHVKVAKNDNDQWDYTMKGDPTQQPVSQRKALLTDPPGEHTSTAGQQQPQHPSAMAGYGGSGLSGADPYKPVYVGSSAYPANAPTMPVVVQAQPQVVAVIPAAAYAPVEQVDYNRADYGGMGYRRGSGGGVAQSGMVPTGAGGGGYVAHFAQPQPVQQQQFQQQGPYNSRAQASSSVDSGSNYNSQRNQHRQQQSQYRTNDADNWSDGSGRQHSCVVMIYGVDHFKFNCKRIFNLLCCYGNCMKVKFMRVKQDTCMAEMSNSRAVTTVMRHLQNLQVFGSPLTFRASKQLNLRDLNEPFEMPDRSCSFEDFARSRNHRFTTQEMAARNRVVPPCEQLWFNAPPNSTEESIAKLFEEHDVKPPHKVTIFPSRSERSCSGLADFTTVEEAAEALMVVNNAPIRESEGAVPYFIKLSFGGAKF